MHQEQKLKDVIGEIIKCKVISFNRFLITKIGLEQIKHRKIVQKIFSRCIPDKKKLQLDCSCLRAQNQEENGKNLEQLGEYVNYIPYNQQILELNLQKNNLGGNPGNMQLLAEIVKNLPIKLQNLELDLSENRLGENVENFKLLGNVLKEHSNGLRCLGLDLG